MRSALRNQKKIYYTNPILPTVTEDADGLFTGDYAKNYTAPQEYKICCNESGNTSSEEYGINRQYSMTMTTSDMRCPLKEDSVVWYGCEPSLHPYNYIVIGRSVSINGIRLICQRVENNA